MLLSRTWHVRRQAQQTARKLLSSLGGFKLAYGLLEELKTVLSSHKVKASSGFRNWGSQTPEPPLPALWDLTCALPAVLTRRRLCVLPGSLARPRSSGPTLFHAISFPLQMPVFLPMTYDTFLSNGKTLRF